MLRSHWLELVSHKCTYVVQRNDLRRARMELAAATEDANQARQELRVVRAELSRSRAAQATVCFPLFTTVCLIDLQTT